MLHSAMRFNMIRDLGRHDLAAAFQTKLAERMHLKLQRAPTFPVR